MPDAASRTADVIVVGSGIIGSFAAYSLSQLGLRIVLVDRAGLAPGTSRASDGNLLLSDKSPGLLFDLGRESLALWEAMIGELGNGCEFDRKGSLVVSLDAGKAAALARHVHEHAEHGVRAEFVTEPRRLEPALAPAAAVAGYWHDDAQVQPMLACYQLARHLQANGAALRLYDRVVAISTAADGVGVTLASGDRLSAGHLVLAAGVWTRELLAPLRLDVPLHPRKGQIAVLERGGIAVRRKIADFAYNDTVENADPQDRSVQTAAIIEATQSGTILCGSSRQFAGFDMSLDEPVLSRIVADCMRFVPALAGLRVIRGYAGLRPYSLDGNPIIGPVDEHGRILVATGHEGSGHGLAPVTGRILAGYLGGRPHPLAEAVSPARFNGRAR
jgi:glycine/D-amino acid oxidase-like deaminating enzyme